MNRADRANKPLQEVMKRALILVDISGGYVVGNNAQHIKWRGCLSSANSYYRRDCVLARKRTDTTGEVVCRLSIKAPESACIPLPRA